MSARAESSTPLERFLQSRAVEPGKFYEAIVEAAAALGMPPISQHHSQRIRYGRSSPTERTIYLLVAAARVATGELVRATDLFLLEPPVRRWMRYRQRVRA